MCTYFAFLVNRDLLGSEGSAVEEGESEAHDGGELHFGDLL